MEIYDALTPNSKVVCSQDTNKASGEIYDDISNDGLDLVQ